MTQQAEAAILPPAEDDSADLGAYQRYLQGLEQTFLLIDRSDYRSANREEARERARFRQGRLISLLEAFGSPHRTLPIVHVAGTSGKGSTATGIASMLQAAGFRVGVHVSPYLQSATEKLQIGEALISGAEFADLVNAVLEVAASLPIFETTPITYGEAWVAMTLVWFDRQQVDLVVLETGAGGRFDLTNVVTPVVSVITSIGLDHLETLGPTIEDIAWHKAGIIKVGAPVVTGVDDSAALAVIEREAVSLDVSLIHATAGEERPAVERSVAFQRQNDRVAIETVRQLAPLGFAVPAEAIEMGLEASRIPGRVELVQRDPVVLLDGAHNPQKMEALVRGFSSVAPVAPGGRRIAVFGALEAKSHRDMLDALLPHVNEVVFTAPQVYGKTPADPEVLLREAVDLGFAGAARIESDPLAAVDEARSRASSGDAIVVTGSMYLVGNARERWFTTRDIVVCRTPWPDCHQAHSGKSGK
jgi:dihydrofolate synthase / folylpolyglutamate synthase